MRIPLAYGVIAACTVMYVRVEVSSLVLNAELARALIPYLVLPFVVGALILVTGLRRTEDEPLVIEAPRNPLQVGDALQMAVMFQIVLFAVNLIRQYWGNVGIIASGAVLGLTDMDALTISMARAAASEMPVGVAARAVATGILANTSLKLALALALGSGRFRRTVAMGLATMAVAVGVALVWR